MKDEHVKDAAQHVAEDVTLDVATDVMGAAEDGGVKVLIVARVILQRWNPRPTRALCPPRQSSICFKPRCLKLINLQKA